jgi:hypothetical protein
VQHAHTYIILQNNGDLIIGTQSRKHPVCTITCTSGGDVGKTKRARKARLMDYDDDYNSNNNNNFESPANPARGRRSRSLRGERGSERARVYVV